MPESLDRSISLCKYNSGVECAALVYPRCYKCGWNPEVSYKRIKNNYGEEYTEYLSYPDNNDQEKGE